MNARSFPYIWPTWLTKLLAGENSCEYAAWYKAHYEKYEKIDDGFDFATWNERHTALINRVRAELEISDAPVKVYTENQNKFTWRHPLATIGGKPDLIALRSTTDHLVVECKTGKHRDSDIVQAKIYMHALPQVLDRHVGREMMGQVAYGHTVDGRMEITKRVDIEMDAGFSDRFIQLVGRVAAPLEARAVPSEQECGFCELAACQYRWKPSPAPSDPPIIVNPGLLDTASSTPSAITRIPDDVRSLPLLDLMTAVPTEPTVFNGIIYDCEILRAIPGEAPFTGIAQPVEDGIEYCKGWRDFAGMGVSIIGVYDYVEDRYRAFCEDNFDEFEELVRSRQWLVGFNNERFDNELLNCNVTDMPQERTYDLLQELWRADGLGPDFDRRTHGGYGLDATCAANFQLKKTGHAALAPILWQKNKVGTVIDYCLNDVKLTKRLLDLVLTREPVRNPKRNGFLTLRHPNDITNG